MAVPSTPLFGNPTRVTADVAIKASPGKLWAVLIEGGTHEDSSIDFYDHAASASGLTPIFGVTAQHSASNTEFINLIPLGGIDFAIGIWADWMGSGTVVYVWFS